MSEEKTQQAKTETQPKFPSEIIDLPSGGKLYGKDSPLYDGKIEIKYMTAREEDILTSQNLIKKGVVLDKLLESLIISKGVKCEDLILGDKNAVMIAARILAYGPEYTVKVLNPNTNEQIEHTFDLSACPFKQLDKSVDLSVNSFECTLPSSKLKIKYKILTGGEEKQIEAELDSLKKLNQQYAPELTTRLRHVITEVDGNDDKATIRAFVSNMLSRDSFYLRKQVSKLAPDIELQQEIDIEGETVKVDIPVTVNFFWPDTSE